MNKIIIQNIAMTLQNKLNDDIIIQQLSINDIYQKFDEIDTLLYHNLKNSPFNSNDLITKLIDERNHVTELLEQQLQEYKQNTSQIIEFKQFCLYLTYLLPNTTQIVTFEELCYCASTKKPMKQKHELFKKIQQRSQSYVKDLNQLLTESCMKQITNNNQSILFLQTDIKLQQFIIQKLILVTKTLFKNSQFTQLTIQQIKKQIEEVMRQKQTCTFVDQKILQQPKIYTKLKQRAGTRFRKKKLVRKQPLK